MVTLWESTLAIFWTCTWSTVFTRPEGIKTKDVTSPKLTFSWEWTDCKHEDNYNTFWNVNFIKESSNNFRICMRFSALSAYHWNSLNWTSVWCCTLFQDRLTADLGVIQRDCSGRNGVLKCNMNIPVCEYSHIFQWLWKTGSAVFVYLQTARRQKVSILVFFWRVALMCDVSPTMFITS